MLINILILLFYLLLRESNKDREFTTEAEMFIVIRESRKGNVLDEETNHTIISYCC